MPDLRKPQNYHFNVAYTKMYTYTQKVTSFYTLKTKNYSIYLHRLSLI